MTEDFENTDTYMKGYFREMRVRDEAGYIVDVQPGMTINLCLQRKLSSNTFSEVEIQQLKLLSSIVAELIIKHWQLTEHAPEAVAESVENALTLFGSSLLTKRELEVLQLLLQGHSNQSAADKLGISLETLRRHRKHIYQKLDIGSQSELFALFINSLPYLTLHPDRDPLLQYHSPQ